MITAATTTVHQAGHGAELGHSPQSERRTGSPRMDPHGPQAAARSAIPVERAIAFGSFRLLPTRRLLLEGEGPVRLGSRAFDILVALVERAGELVSKDEIMARVWPNTFVEESTSRSRSRGCAGSSAIGGAAIGTWPRFPAAATVSWRRSCSRKGSRRGRASAQSAGSDRAHGRPHRCRDRAQGPAVALSPRHDRGPRRHRQDNGRPRGGQGAARRAGSRCLIR